MSRAELLWINFWAANNSALVKPVMPEDLFDLPSPPTDASDNRRTFSLEVVDKIDAVRLDQFVVNYCTDISRSLIKKAIDAGKVTVNGKPAKASYKVRFGDQIFIEFPTPYHGPPSPEDIPLDIVYEDEHLAVINKPCDMVVHPAKGNWKGTLVNALQHHFTKLSLLNGEFRSGIVHRLDRDTSGVILIAKDDVTHRDLGQQFEHRQVYKEYLAITAGVLDRDSDYIERSIARHKYDRVKMAVTDDAGDGKPACSFYEVLERFDGFTYCLIAPKTGRTHQIRVHLASLDCPVLADKVYSGRDCLRLSELQPNVETDEVLMPRQALHAHRLRFTHPVRKEAMEAIAPIPEEFTKTLEALRLYRRCE